MVNINKVLQYLQKLGPAKKLVEDVEFLIDAIKKNPFKYGAIVTTALLYLLNPFDLVPDMIPVAGLVDDAGVIAIAVATIKKMINSL